MELEPGCLGDLWHSGNGDTTTTPVADRARAYTDKGRQGGGPARKSASTVYDVVKGGHPAGSNRHKAQNYSDAEISATEIHNHALLTGFQRSRPLAFIPMERSASDPREIEFYENLAWRLKLAVEAINRPKGEIAESIGISQSRLSNWITNQNKPDWFGIAKFCKRYGVSADWILLGDLSGLKANLADSLAQASEGRLGSQTAARHRLPGTAA